MRRKDREITDINEAFDVLSRCNTVRIGLSGQDYPYVVPVSFGTEMHDGRPIVFFHCARHGMKVDLLQENPRVCVEGDIFLGTEATQGGITTRYESVIGFGTCQIATEEDEIIHGLQLLIDHYGYDSYPLEHCQGMRHLLVGKIVLDELTGKRNLPEHSGAASRGHE